VQPKARRYFTPEEYLAIEREAEYKSEYFDGEIFALAGASREHCIISGNIHALLHAQLRGRACNVYISDMRVKVDALGKYTYPDVVVACDERFEEAHGDTLLNPRVIFEVLSPSTSAYDRGRKFAHYDRVESLGEYYLVHQDHRHVESYFREADGSWHHSGAVGIGSGIVIPTIGCELELADIYEGLAIPETADELAWL
jgi:Uma2 family endonuclease